ncbi:unnamed protein product [Heligmosomoides polygyrus]|uniref:acid phosphatase n=1 Tax=Heligmosomoides polygyrus TaxID=6339 RepID=A0A183GHS1_HELPZ|nr:unnamed protein product [Heligmosomoides polygyrus]
MVWRHGDRSPMKTCQTDPIQERNWTFGGGGYGQLSPIGMKQHLKFGKLLRKKYVEEMGFLSKRYSSKEIYIRSTDRNRTIISAISNLLGMYGQNDGTNVVGVDYPDDADWPAGFVPVAIHTSDHSRDHVRRFVSIINFELKRHCECSLEKDICFTRWRILTRHAIDRQCYGPWQNLLVNYKLFRKDLT